MNMFWPFCCRKDDATLDEATAILLKADALREERNRALAIRNRLAREEADRRAAECAEIAAAIAEIAEYEERCARDAEERKILVALAAAKRRDEEERLREQHAKASKAAHKQMEDESNQRLLEVAEAEAEFEKWMNAYVLADEVNAAGPKKIACAPPFRVLENVTDKSAFWTACSEVHTLYHKHPLVPSSRTTAWVCDGRRAPGGCRQQHDAKGGDRYRCTNEACDYDLCAACKEAFQTSAHAKRASVTGPFEVVAAVPRRMEPSLAIAQPVINPEVQRILASAQPLHNSGELPVAMHGSNFKLSLLTVSSEELGAGAFGKVSKGVYDDQLVAVKEIRLIADKRTRQHELVKQEIAIGLAARHDNIVRTLGAVEYENRFVIVLEYCTNGALSKYMQTNAATLTLKQRLALAQQCAEGLHHLHTSQKMMHSDVKLDNFVVTADGIAKLCVANEIRV